MARVTFVVSPGARATELVGRHGDAWKARVAAPPERGRANEELCAWLARLLGIERRDVTVVAGAAARRKVVEASGVDAGALEERLERAAAE